MNEQLKRLCPITIVKELGKEAVWLYQTAQQVRQMVAETAYEADDER